MLNDARCRSLPQQPKPYRVADGGSLFLCIRPSGGKSWEFRYKRDGAVKAVVLGQYPALGLKAARQARDKLKVMLAGGLDPIARKQIAREEERQRLEEVKAARAQSQAQKAKHRTTLEVVSLAWVERNRRLWTEQHAAQVEQSLRDHVFPRIGALPIASVTTRDVLAVLDNMVAAGKLETASRVMQRLGAVFAYAALHHGVIGDPAALVRREFFGRLKLARKRQPKQNFPAIAPAELPALLRALREYEGPSVALVRLIALTSARTSEARRATWSEFDLDKALWIVPPTRMKARKAHTVPLSRQALELLRGLEAKRTISPYVFVHPTNLQRPASENAVLYVLAAIGYRGRQSGHGFRSLFSTIANESGLWHKETIEVAIAHGDQDAMRAAYNRAEFLEERSRLMQWWADELDRLEAGTPAKVKAIRARA
jgi:integrase